VPNRAAIAADDARMSSGAPRVSHDAISKALIAIRWCAICWSIFLNGTTKLRHVAARGNVTHGGRAPPA